MFRELLSTAARTTCTRSEASQQVRRLKGGVRPLGSRFRVVFRFFLNFCFFTLFSFVLIFLKKCFTKVFDLQGRNQYCELSDASP